MIFLLKGLARGSKPDTLHLVSRVASRLISPTNRFPFISQTYLQSRQISLIQHQPKRPSAATTLTQTKFIRPGIGILSKTQTRGAAFWRLGTNVKLFRRMLKESGSSELRYRILLFIGVFIVLNFLFNVMMAVLTNLYLDTLQETPSSFGLWVNGEFKAGVVNEQIKYNDRGANEKYDECLRTLARDNGLIKDIQNPESGYILSVDQLDKWYYDKHDLQYVSCYIDLLLRYSLTLGIGSSREIVHTINHANGLIQHYEELAKEQVGSYILKNKALRTLADILRSENGNFDDIEALFKGSIYLLESNEFKTRPNPEEDYTIVPATEISSDNLTNSLMDLSLFYTSTNQPELLDKALAILISELRSLEYEFKSLGADVKSGAIVKEKASNLQNDEQRRLVQLKSEHIPLVKLQISEILFAKKAYNRAIEIAKDSAYHASLHTSGNPNCAKIAKIGFRNLSVMYNKMGDQEASELCATKDKDIEVPLNAFIDQGYSVRDVVLRYYFGDWGNFLFPGK